MKKLPLLPSAMWLLALVAPLAGQTKGIVTFGGLKNLEFINNYYDGGQGSQGSGPGQNFGLQFTSNAQAIVRADNGGSGNFTNDPGNYPVMMFLTGTSVTITAPAGVTSGLYFFYSALKPGTATLYDGPNGSGNILASITLSPNNAGCNTYLFCKWTPVGVPLAATVGSIRFTGVASYLAIGSIHLGRPLPTTMALTSAPNPSLRGQPVTVTVAMATSVGAIPAGTVKFKTNNVTVGQVSTSGGFASITLSSLPVGTTPITARFTGTGFVAATMSIFQVVN